MIDQKMLLAEIIFKKNETTIKKIYKKVQNFLNYDEFADLCINIISELDKNNLDDSNAINEINHEVKIFLLIQKTNLFISNTISIGISFFDDLTKIYSDVHLNFDDKARIRTNILDNPTFNRIISNFFNDNFIKCKNSNVMSMIFSKNEVFSLFENYCFKNNYCIYDYYMVPEKTYSLSLENDYLLSLDKKILTEEEEKIYVTKMINGDESARKLLIEHNLRLVVSIAKGYRNRGLDFMDLIQEGNVGLIKGIDHFNPNKGYKISTYVSHWIKQSIMDALYDKGNVGLKISRNKRVLIQKIRKTENALVLKNGYKPSAEEIANYLNISAQKVKEAMAINDSILSLDEEYGSGNDTYSLKDIIPDSFDLESTIEKNLLSLEIERLFKLTNITNQEKNILRLRNGFYNNYIFSYEEIGNKLHISKERVRQIELNCLRRLKNASVKNNNENKINKVSILNKGVSKSIKEYFWDYSIDEIKEALCDLNENDYYIYIFYYKSSIDEKIQLNKLSDNQYQSICVDFFKRVNQKLIENREWNCIYQIMCSNIKNYGKLNIYPEFRTLDGITYDENGVNLHLWLSMQKTLLLNSKLSEGKKRKLCDNKKIIEYLELIDSEMFEKRASLCLTLKKLFYKVAYKKYDCTISDALRDIDLR